MSFKEINVDSLGTAEKVFDFLRMEFTSDMKRGIEAWNEKHPHNKFSKSRYTLQNYGVDEKRIDEEFKEYAERFADYLQ